MFKIDRLADGDQPSRCAVDWRDPAIGPPQINARFSATP
jgi:hypothetical protein